MKKLILLLFAAAPTIGFAQQGASDAITSAKWEVGATTGITTASHDADLGCTEGLATASLSLLRNFKNLQLGVGVDYDIFPDDYFNITPRIILNRKFDFKKVYVYVGATAGYASRQHNPEWNQYAKTSSKGYMTGVQTGVVYRVSKHLALNMEVGVRSVHLWNTPNGIGVLGDVFMPNNQTSNTYFPSAPINFFELHIPTTMGIRYSF